MIAKTARLRACATTDWNAQADREWALGL